MTFPHFWQEQISLQHHPSYQPKIIASQSALMNRYGKQFVIQPRKEQRSWNEWLEIK